MNVCIPYKSIDFIFTILIQVAIAFIFLTLFFFLYVSKIEQRELQHQVYIIIDSFIGDLQQYTNIISPLVSPEEKEQLKQKIIDTINQQQQDSINESKNIDSKVNQQNLFVRSKSFNLLLGGVSVLAFSILVLFIIGLCLPIREDLFKGLTILLVVAIVEYSFLTFVAEKYIIADTNFIKRSIADVVLNYVKTRKTNI